MRTKNVIPTCVCVLLATCAMCFAGELAIDQAQSDKAKQLLAAYENGKMSVEDFTGDAAQARLLLAYYLSHTNEVTTKMKLPISGCFFGFSKYTEAAQLAGEYVNVYSNDWHGWSMLGCAKFLMQSYEGAINAYTNAVRLGDEGSYVGLGGAALATDRLDILRETVVPHLLSLKNAKATTSTEKLDMVGVIVSYALKADQKDVFVRALEGVKADDIMSRDDDLTTIVRKGCERFKASETEKLCKQLTESLARGTRTNR